MGNEIQYLKEIENVMIFDDDDDSREAIAEKVEDAKFKAFSEKEKLHTIDECMARIRNRAIDAVICDHHLSQKNYAPFKGIEIIKKTYQNFIPSLLATSYVNADKAEFQCYRKFIPTIIKPTDITPDLIVRSFEICKKEFSGIYSPVRKPWRSLIRIEDISEDKKFVYVVVPSWSSNEKVRLPISNFPIQNEQLLGMRFFSHVNIGAENYEDLYFDGFTEIEKPQGKYATLLRC